MSTADMEVSADHGLRIWADWMRSPSDLKELGYPDAATGFITGGIHCYDDLTESVDAVMAQGIGVIVEGLPTLERSAVYCEYLCCVFRAREGVLEAALASALTNVARRMLERGLL